MLPRSVHFSLFCSIAAPELDFPCCKSTSLGIPSVSCRRGGRHVLNPWDKIADPCMSWDRQCPYRCPPAAAGLSRRGKQPLLWAPAGSLVGSSQLRSRSSRQRCGVCGRGSPWGL